MPNEPTLPGFQQMPSSMMDGDQAGEVRVADEIGSSVPPFDEIGASGLKRSAGFVDEEFLPQLRGRKAVQVYKEMSENDPLVGAMLYSIQMLLRNVEWVVEPGGKTKADTQMAELIESCMEDMEHTWDEFITEVLTMLVFGWSWFEVVYKRRGGLYNTNPKLRSKYQDGLIGWRKIPIRAQETLFKWIFDETGEVAGMVQMPPPSYQQIILPSSRSLLFRFQTSKGNPEGKALAADTPVWTPNGWKNHGDLVAGDQVFDDEGRIRYVVATQGWASRPRYKVTFNDGTSLIADENHEWVTQTKAERAAGVSGQVRTTGEMAATTKIRGTTNHTIAWAKPLDHPAQLLPVDPWVLGLWLGDGDTRGSRIACHVDDVNETVAFIEQAGYPCKHDQNGNSANGRAIKVFGGLQASLGELGVQGDKHIPEVYLRGSVAQRQALLAGLMDSDGTVDADGRCEFVNTNMNLVEGVAHLVRSLGGQAHVRLRKRANGTSHMHDSWCVKFTPTFVPFQLSRKIDRIKDVRARTRHYVVSVERVKDGPTNCIQVDGPSHLYLAGESMVPTHNSLLRNVYRPWYYKKRIEEFEAVGVERDLAGLPMVSVPAEWLNAKAGSQQHKTVLEFKKMVKSIRRDEQEGLVFPIAYDQDTKQPLFKFELLGSGGGRQFPTDAIIQRYEQRMLMSVLADFIMVGHQGTGSYSMHVDKTGIFRTSLNAISEAIAQVLNRHAIPRLIRLNGWNPAQLPQIKAMDVDAPDITQLGAFMTQMAGLGMEWFPNADMEQFIRKAARLPEVPKDSVERIELQQARAEKTSFLTTQAQFVAAKMQLSQQVQAMVDAANPGTPDPTDPFAAQMEGAGNDESGGSAGKGAGGANQGGEAPGSAGGSGGGGNAGRGGVGAGAQGGQGGSQI